jgi:hypothetical protein
MAMAGFSIISPKLPEQAPKLIAKQKVDAVVIGHSVPVLLRKALIIELRRRCPNCIVCFVYVDDFKTQEEPLADVSLDVTHGSGPLLIALQERLPG